MIVFEQREGAQNERTLQTLMELTRVGPLSAASRIENAAAVIVSLMTEIHGGEWRSKIDHPAGYVMIVPY